MRTYLSNLLLVLTLALASCGDTTSVVTCEETSCRPDEVCLAENPGFGVLETSCVMIGCDDQSHCLETEECVIEEEAALTQKLTLAPRAGICMVPCENDEECDGSVCDVSGFCAKGDCRADGCDAGNSCQACLVFEDGVEYVCIPDGAIC